MCKKNVDRVNYSVQYMAMKGNNMEPTRDITEQLIERLSQERNKWADRAMIAEKYIPTSRFAEYRKEAYGRED